MTKKKGDTRESENSTSAEEDSFDKRSESPGEARNETEIQDQGPPPSPEIPKGSKFLQAIFFTSLFGAVLAFGVLAGPNIKEFVGELFSQQDLGEETALANDTNTDEGSTWYIDTMHPWIIQPEPGFCPICGMELVPVDPDRFTGEIAIDPVVLQNIGVRVKTITTGPVIMDIRTVGNVTYDETLVRDVNLKVSGWAEKVNIDFVGSYVRKGQPLLEIYAPELYSTQEEYLLLYKNKSLPGNEEIIKAVRTRLQFFDITDEQIKDLEESGKPSKTMTIKAPFDGYVIEKNVNEGMRLTPGMLLYRIADLSRIWVQVTLYEYQLPYISVNQDAEMDLSYLPNQNFKGKITYIYPYLDQRTREVQVRLEFKNPDVLLKPGMYANVRIQSKLADESTLVPNEALIRTGVRTIAFVSLGEGKFEPRDVTIGSEVQGNMFEVIDGLEPGEKVVVSGQFLLDSESRVRESLAKMIKGDLASDQLPEFEFSSPTELIALPKEAQGHLGKTIKGYLAIHKALYADTLIGVDKLALELTDNLENLGKNEVPGKPHFWHERSELGTIQKHAAYLAAADDLQKARVEFGAISIALDSLLKATGLPSDLGVELMGVKCGMFSEAPEGGMWLQAAGKTRNPYFGSSTTMKTCSAEKWGFTQTTALASNSN